MGGISGFIDSITGKAGMDAQEEQNKRNELFIKEQSAQAKRVIKPLFDYAQRNIEKGSQAALDVFAQTIPEQYQSIRNANYGAQEQLLAGLPQIQNALLGNPVDMGALQPHMLARPSGFIKQQVPNFTSPDLNQRFIDNKARDEAKKAEEAAALAAALGGNR